MKSVDVAGLYISMATASLLCGWLWGVFPTGATSPQQLPILFYQQAIGYLDGRSCPSYPVCSRYAHEALERHGALVGSWLIIDRLIHEADDLEHGIWIGDQGDKRLYDPLERNDFWLTRGEAE